MNSNLKLLSAGLLVAVLALAGCGGGSDTPATDMTAEPDPAIAERGAIKTAIDAAETAVAMVDNDSTDAEVQAADDAIAAARKAITDAAAVPAAEKAANTGTVDAIASRLMAAKTSRTAAMDADQKAADTAMMATAKKLYMGIGTAPLTATGDGQRSAAYSGTNDPDITLTIDDAAVGDGSDTTQVLTEDKKAMVAALHGWSGKKYTASGTGVDGTYEAVVYSNVGDATEGDPFNEEYTLTDGALAIDTSASGTPASRVASSSFDQSAGLKRFKLPDPNPSGVTKITVSGSYHGVSGIYTCTPATGSTCVSRVAASGFDLGVVDASNTFAAGSWSFAPTTPTTKVMSVADMHYASYGWWIHKGADGTYTVSAFVDDKDDGTDTNVPVATGVTALQGSATYSGGAAGKYALYSSTGGTNDAGHFTARATLEADFSKSVSATGITGTIDQFVGADGNARNWEVELMGSAISNGGLIRALNADGSTEPVDTDAGAKTKWTIDGSAAAASGAWSGSIQNNGDDGVPRVASGTFHSEYSTSGRMVGAFGANKQ